MGLPTVRSWLSHGHRQLHLARWMLEIDDREVEREFLAYDDLEGARQSRSSLLIAVAFTAVYGGVDLILAGSDAAGSLIVRYGIVIPIVLVALAIRDRPPVMRHLQAFTALLVTLLLVFLGPVTAAVSDFSAEYVRASATVTLIGAVGLLRIRMHAAWTIGLAYVLSNVVIALLDDARSTTDIVGHLAPTLGQCAIALLIAYALEKLRRTDFLRQREVELEQARSDALLNNVLPPTIAARLRAEPGTIAESAVECSVLFSDIVGFTPLSETLDPAELVRLLDTMFREFDQLCDEHGIEKVKTIGDAYMAVAGLPDPNADHAASLAELALDMQRAVTRFAAEWPSPVALRIGIASGPAVAGVIGQRKFSYDLWGDTVNTASRMESHGRPNRIQVSESTRTLLADRYEFSDPQAVEVKGKGAMTTYFLLGRAPGTLAPSLNGLRVAP